MKSQLEQKTTALETHMLEQSKINQDVLEKLVKIEEETKQKSEKINGFSKVRIF